MATQAVLLAVLSSALLEGHLRQRDGRQGVQCEGRRSLGEGEPPGTTWASLLCGQPSQHEAPTFPRDLKLLDPAPPLHQPYPSKHGKNTDSLPSPRVEATKRSISVNTDPRSCQLLSTPSTLMPPLVMVPPPCLGPCRWRVTGFPPPQMTGF
ncbi:hypothetical protein E2C01_061375 [Portunus trituberculatus]|uniref:Uncharacterized protein n=1 Tax=Portunus trituberculatus TaxID=210409 RepID=A0A5B7HD06_PORTR|nr:hypothetical protein [Portunus trituberculatus]